MCFWISCVLEESVTQATQQSSPTGSQPLKNSSNKRSLTLLPANSTVFLKGESLYL